MLKIILHQNFIASFFLIAFSSFTWCNLTGQHTQVPHTLLENGELVPNLEKALLSPEQKEPSFFRTSNGLEIDSIASINQLISSDTYSARFTKYQRVSGTTYSSLNTVRELRYQLSDPSNVFDDQTSINAEKTIDALTQWSQSRRVSTDPLQDDLLVVDYVSPDANGIRANRRIFFETDPSVFDFDYIISSENIQGDTIYFDERILSDSTEFINFETRVQQKSVNDANGFLVYSILDRETGTTDYTRRITNVDYSFDAQDRLTHRRLERVSLDFIANSSDTSLTSTSYSYNSSPTTDTTFFETNLDGSIRNSFSVLHFDTDGLLVRRESFRNTPSDNPDLFYIFTYEYALDTLSKAKTYALSGPDTIATSTTEYFYRQVSSTTSPTAKMTCKAIQQADGFRITTPSAGEIQAFDATGRPVWTSRKLVTKEEAIFRPQTAGIYFIIHSEGKCSAKVIWP